MGTSSNSNESARKSVSVALSMRVRKGVIADAGALPRFVVISRVAVDMSMVASVATGPKENEILKGSVSAGMSGSVRIAVNINMNSKAGVLVDLSLSLEDFATTATATGMGTSGNANKDIIQRFSESESVRMHASESARGSAGLIVGGSERQCAGMIADKKVSK